MSSRNNPVDWRSLARMIDHTNLRPEATPNQIVRLCEEAQEYGFCSVMVNASHVALCYSLLRGAGERGDVKVGAVAGFPLGATLTSVKVFEAMEATKLG